MRMLWVLIAGLGALVTAASGCSPVGCPTINCRPEIGLTYAHPVADPYAVSVTVKGETLTAACPTIANGSSQLPRLDFCDGGGLVVSGVDLGHGSNDSLNLAVSFDGGEPISVTASLTRIVNASTCDLVCYRHDGIVANQ
jgi:hypothetical protein